MKKFLAGVVIALGFVSEVFGQTCPGCILNNANPQVAVFNVSSATIRGQLNVGELSMSTISASTVTALNFIGSGTYMTNLNASQLGYGTVPSARIIGNYPGITGISTITSGVWNGAILGSQYGGTGSNLVTASSGSIAYFSSVGTMSALAPATAGYLLQTNGVSSAPAWTGVPQVLGTNITGIPMANLIPGQLPTNISVNDASISTVSAAKVIGNIPGNATNITGILQLSHLSSGTFNTSNAASSVTASGVTPGIYGGPYNLPQITVAYDGRITSISQSTFSVNISSLASGPLPSGVTIGASQVTSGVLGGGVIASSIAATAVTPGSYGTQAKSARITVSQDGRLSFANELPILISASTQIAPGTFPAGVLIPPANITSGALPGNVVASSLTLTGVTAGTYGNASHAVQVSVGLDGRVISINSFAIPGVSSTSVATNIDNGWTATQTFFSSITVHSTVGAVNFTGDGTGVFNLQPSNMSSGNLPASVTASSLTANTVTPITVAVGNYPHISIPASNVTTGTLSSSVVASSVSLTYLTVPSSVTALTFIGDGSHLTGIDTSSSSVIVPGSGLNSAVAYPGVSSNSASGNYSSILGGRLHSTSGQFSTVGGGDNNSTTDIYATISGGHTNSAANVAATVSGGESNNASGPYSTIAGGFSNVASGDTSSIGGGKSNASANVYTVVAGGRSNTASAQYSTVGGGDSNSASGSYSTIAGGRLHFASGNTSTVGGGGANEASGDFSTIAGGTGNIASENTATIAGGQANSCGGPFCFVGGGQQNASSNTFASVLGGSSNSATGSYASILGGSDNVAGGNYALAYGRRGKANSDGSIVFADDSNVDYLDHGSNTFNIRSNGGVFVDSGSLTVEYGVAASTFSGDGASLINLTAANISAGFLGGSVIASSIAANGVSSGTYGNATFVPQITLGYDGRISAVSNVAITGIPASSVPASGVQAGSLGSGVIASSIAVNSINSSSQIVAGTIRGSNLADNTLTNTQMSAGTFSNISIPAANVNSGTLGSSVITSSVAASGVIPGTYGDSANVSQIVIGVDGRIFSAINVPIPGISTGSAFVNVDNDWTATQTFLSSVTVISSFTATSIAGNGALITHLTPTNITAGILPANVIASSVAATSVSSGSYGSATQVGSFTVGVDGRLTSASNTTITGVPAATVPASGVQAGNLGSSVIASSIAASGVASSTYGSATQTSQVSVGIDGRITSASNVTITGIPASNIAAGTSSITGLGTQVQPLNMGSSQINNLADPTSTQDAATKNYVDSNLNGLEYKASARLATTAALPANSYSNGSSGVGATITGLSIGTLTIDGATANTNDRVLINNEILSSHNGIYTVTQNSALVVFILTRATDYDQPSEMANGTALFIDSGTVNSNAGFVNTSSIMVVGTDPIVFTQFNGLGDVTAGAGLIKSGNTLSVDPSSVAFLSSGAVGINIGGTGATNASSARTNLSAAQSGSNGDITALTVLATITNPVTMTSSMTNTSSGGTKVKFGITAGSSTILNSETVVSTLTVLGNGFSVGTSTFVISNGHVSIGTSTVSSDLTVIQSSTSTPAIRMENYSDDAVGSAIIGRKARGSINSPTAVQANDRMATFGGLAYDGSVFPSSSTANVQMFAKNNQSASDHSSYIVFNTVSSGTTTMIERMRVDSTGNVGISTTVPVSTLTVVGTFLATSTATANTFVGNGYNLTGITVSSATSIANGTFTNTVLGVCFATVTVTTRGFPVFISLQATGQSTLGGATSVTSSYLIDGAVPGDSGSKPILNVQYANANHDFPLQYRDLNSGIAAGSHSFCLTLATSSGTGSIFNDATHYTQFFVQEHP